MQECINNRAQDRKTTPTIIRELRDSTGMTQKEFAELYQIPLSTLRKWEQGTASPPDYVIRLIARSLPYRKPGLKKIGDGERSYYYDPDARTLEDKVGHKIPVKSDLSKVKPQNLLVYVTELFDSYYDILEKFERDCRYDKKENII